MLDFAPLIDAGTKTPIGGDPTNGSALYTSCIACHGEDGRVLNFGSTDEPEYVGTIALDNPWEFLHKIWSGQPGAAGMPAAMDEGWSLQDLVDLLAFAQTLPVVAP